MATKRKGVITRPGKYKYGDTEETKTPEELKAAVERQPIIMLTMGHPPGGMPKAADFIGTVAQKWDEENQRVMGDFWFYDDYTPEHILTKVRNGQPVEISPGFALDSVEEGVQKGYFYTHVAIVEDGEDPICPLNQCGVNVRMESNPPTNMRYEQKSEVKEDKPVETKPEEQYVKFEDFSAFKQEILDAISTMKPATTEVEEEKASGTAVDDTPPGMVVTAEPEPVQEKVTVQPKPEPEVTIPADVASPSTYGPGVEETADGWLKIVPQTKKKSE